MLALSAGLEAIRRGADVVGVQDAPHEVAAWMCAAIAAEIGSKNDQLTPVVWHHGRQRVCALGELTARVESLGGSVAVAISSPDGGPLGFTMRGLRRFVNPAHAVVEGPGFERLVFFPVSISKIVGAMGADVVFVPAWAREQVFHPTRGSDEPYGEDFKHRRAWDTFAPNLLLFCSLLARRKLVLVSTHDLVAHLAGFDAALWPGLEAMAARIEACVRTYLARLARPGVETLILPFLLGVLLDIHAQPSSQQSARQLRVLVEAVADYLDRHGARLARAATPRLEVFPREYAPFMTLLASRDDEDTVRRHAWALLDAIAAQTTTRRAA